MRVIFISIVLFFFIIDSGGPLGLRNIAAAIVVFGSFSFFIIKFRYISISRDVLVAFFFLALNASFSILVSTGNSIELSEVMVWIIPYISFPLFVLFFSIFKRCDLYRGVIVCGWIFSSLIFFVFVMFILYGDTVSLYFKELNYPGWFYIRQDGYPQVYFQSTLSLVVFSVFAFMHGYKYSSIIFTIALGLCLSRFGVLVSVFFILLSLTISARNLSKITLISFIPLNIVFLISIYVIYSMAPVGIDYTISSSMIRFGHLNSIVEQSDLISTIFGNGAGSYFYSIGFERLTNNIEVSQLEILRKYGLLGYILVGAAFFVMQVNLFRRGEFKNQVSLFAFYLVSYSNPVLMTFMFSIFSGVFLSRHIKVNGKLGLSKNDK